MKVTVRVDEYVTADVSAEEVLAELPSEAGATTIPQVQGLISRCHACLQAVPDDLIAQLTPKARQTAARALRAQVERYDADTTTT